MTGKRTSTTCWYDRAGAAPQGLLSAFEGVRCDSCPCRDCLLFFSLTFLSHVQSCNHTAIRTDFDCLTSLDILYMVVKWRAWGDVLVIIFSLVLLYFRYVFSVSIGLSNTPGLADNASTNTTLQTSLHLNTYFLNGEPEARVGDHTQM